MRQDGEHLLGELLKTWAKECRLEKKFDEINAQEAWKKIMGKNMIKYTKEIFLRKGTLHVHLISSTMREELSYNKDKIIRALNKSLGEEIIKKLILQ